MTWARASTHPQDRSRTQSLALRVEASRRSAPIALGAEQAALNSSARECKFGALPAHAAGTTPRQIRGVSTTALVRPAQYERPPSTSIRHSQPPRKGRWRLPLSAESSTSGAVPASVQRRASPRAPSAPCLARKPGMGCATAVDSFTYATTSTSASMSGRFLSREGARQRPWSRTPPISLVSHAGRHECFRGSAASTRTSATATEQWSALPRSALLRAAHRDRLTNRSKTLR